MQGKTVSMSGHRKLTSCGYATKRHEKWHLPAVKKRWRKDKSEKLSKFVIKTFCSRDSNFVCLKQTTIIENVQGLRQYQPSLIISVEGYHLSWNVLQMCLFMCLYILDILCVLGRMQINGKCYHALSQLQVINKILSYMEDQSGPEIPSSSSFCRTLHPFPAKDFESFYWFVRSSLRSALRLVRFVC